MLKRLTKQILQIVNLEGHIDTDAAERSIRGNIDLRGPNAWILAVAIIIASIGLNVNSIPVIIGAMLISPLMGPIFGLGLGLGINDIELMKKSGKNLLVMVSISVVVSLVYFLVTPLSLTNPTELLARTNPTIYDVMIALFGGFAGIFEQCRKEKGTVFSGVAIATALMPPLCTAGFGLANGNLGYFMGALYLFCINCLFITLATYFMVKYLHFKKMEYQEEKFGRRTQRLTTILIILFLVPSIWSAVILVKQTNFEDHAIAFVEHNKSIEKCIIYDYKISHTDGSVLEIFLTGEPISDQARANLYAYALEHGIKAEQLSIREYTTAAGAQNNELFKNLYDRLDTEVSQREKTISILTQELESLKTQELPYIQLAKEIRATHPAISDIVLTRGVHVSADSLQMTPYVLVKIHADSSMTRSRHQQLEEWLKVRLETNNLKVDISDSSIVSQ